MASEKSKVLVIGGTGFLGKKLVKASLREGHATYVFQRRENRFDVNRARLLLRLKERGAILIEGSLSEHESLVCAVKRVDAVIFALSPSHPSKYKIVHAIKEAGNIKTNVVDGKPIGQPSQEEKIDGASLQQLEVEGQQMLEE
ncbi:hypothetical protein Scep_006933 [Stephania cephalantha]|uniref:NmrA-like domain-containing protein n=1 Tax=Stephania cephalantha TaxID=152367 RepID=A0AAP0K8W9_9MAGN